MVDRGMNEVGDGKIEISQEYYNELLEDSQFLDALMGAGVDNWGGYDIALEMLQGPEGE